MLSTLKPTSITFGKGSLLHRKRSRIYLRDPAASQQPTVLPESLQEERPQWTTTASKQILALESAYHRWIQNNVDPLLGKKRNEQLQEILGDGTEALTLEERFANLRIALGGIAVASSLLSFIFPPAIGVTFLVGLSILSTPYYLAYEDWQRTHKIGTMHLMAIYVTYLWFGGYALIGATTSVLMGLFFKVRALTENRSRNNLINVFQLQPDKVWVRHNELEVEIDFAQLQIGDILVLHAGQIVPVDGVVLTGAATVDQHALTGEAQPVEKMIGDPVMASTMVISGRVDVRVEKTGTETTAGQIGELLNQATNYNAKMMVKTMDMANQAAMPTLVVSGASIPLVGLAGAISLLGANFTIQTLLTSPLVLLNYLNMAAKRSILIKDGGALEQLNDVDTIVFDKTGTLTLEQPHVTQIHVIDSVEGQIDETAVLTLAAAAESRQTHPIARAILAAAEEAALTWPVIDQAHYEIGYGIKVWFDRAAISDFVPSDTAFLFNMEPSMAAAEVSEEKLSTALAPQNQLVCRVGSMRFMQMEGIAVPVAVETLATTCHAQGHSLVMVALNHQLIGCIELQPTIRPEANIVIDQLRQLGVSMYIISGDQEAPTQKLANDLGMTGYFANTLPEAKGELVEELRHDGGQVCFIGDGINDAIAMRKADVSISLRGATTAATDTAQIILMDGDLNQLPHLFALAERYDRNLKRNFRFTVGTSAVAVSSVLLAGFSFAAIEALYTASLVGSLWIALEPLLAEKEQEKE